MKKAQNLENPVQSAYFLSKFKISQIFEFPSPTGFSSFFWSEDDINARLVRIMKEAFAGIWEVAQDHKVSLRTATFIVGCKRILQARELRGLYP